MSDEPTTGHLPPSEFSYRLERAIEEGLRRDREEVHALRAKVAAQAAVIAEAREALERMVRALDISEHNRNECRAALARIDAPRDAMTPDRAEQIADRPVKHPIRNEPINVWCAPEGQASPRWLAMFGIGRAFPIYFAGETEIEARQRAEDFRSDVIARNEAAFIARQENLAKARAARAKGKSAGDPQP